RAATRHVAHAIGSGQERRVPDLAWTAAGAQFALGLAASLALLAMTPVLIGHVLNISPNLQPEARSTFHVLSLALPLIMLVGSVRGLLEAAQRFDLVNAIGGPLAFGNFLLPCIGVSLGWGLPVITGLLVLSSAVGVAMYLRMCTRVFPAILSRPRFKRDEFGR